jgi:hypothetical protein
VSEHVGGLPRLQELRRTRRIAVCFRAEFSGRHVRGSGTVQNISLSGALIEEANPLLLTGAEIVLRFPFFHDSLPVELPARVVRETAAGFGVHFRPLASRLHRVLTLAISRVALSETKPGTAVAGAALLETVRVRSR